MRKIILTVTSIISLITALIVFAIGCDSTDQASVQRHQAISQRAQIFARAEALYPVPDTRNFPMRKALVKYTERQDIMEHLYYVYVLADTGNYIGYYVAQSQPVSTNAFLSSTEDLSGDSYGRVVMTAPSLDGVYYGGAGGSSGSGWFFFDAATDALVILYDVKIFVADQPLMLDVKPILVQPTVK